MTNVTMKANDTLHVSAVSPDNLAKGQTFEVPSYVADDLEARGLASRVDSPEPETAQSESVPPEPAKSEPPIDNKMEHAPANKAVLPASTKRAAAKKA